MGNGYSKEQLMTQGIGEKLGYVISSADMDMARNTMRRAIMSKGPNVKIIIVPVDYDLSVEDRNKAAAFDVLPEGVTSDVYPATRDGRVELEVHLLVYGCYTFAKEILEIFETRGLRFLDMAELQSIAMHHPALQGKRPIVMLDSSEPKGAFLCKAEGGRMLILFQGDKPLNGGWCFAGTPK